MKIVKKFGLVLLCISAVGVWGVSISLLLNQEDTIYIKRHTYSFTEQHVKENIPKIKVIKENLVTNRSGTVIDTAIDKTDHRISIDTLLAILNDE